MLKKFYAQNYRNLKFAEPLYFNDITGVYGLCASGKSNFCRALGDITSTYPAGNVANNRDSLLFYTFEYDRRDIELCYKRNKEGVIRFVRFCDLGAKTVHISTIESNDIQAHLAHIRRELVAAEFYAISFMDRLLKEIKNIQVYIDDAFHDSKKDMSSCIADLSVNCADRCLCEDNIENASMIIYDDIDIRKDLTESFMKHALVAGIPVIYTTRRAETIGEWCKEVEDCVLIHEGTVAYAASVSNKDLRTLNKLTSFLERL